MPQTPRTFLLQGGLNSEAAPIAFPDGQLIACENYEPDVAGYTRFGGYERFDGRSKPSSAHEDFPELTTEQKDALREFYRGQIGVVPGKGEVLACWSVTDASGDNVYAIRENSGDTECTMYRASASGWVAIERNYIMYFDNGAGTLGQPEEGNYGETSNGFTFRIDRVVLLSGTYSGGDASGYFVISDHSTAAAIGADAIVFYPDEASADATSGEYLQSERAADVYRPADRLAATISPFGWNSNSDLADTGAAADAFAGKPIFEVQGNVSVRTHIFTTGDNTKRSYIATGSPWAFEFDGVTLAPIRADAIESVFTGSGTSYSSMVKYTKVAVYREHLFLATDGGTIINSAPNDPLDFKAVSGAAEIGLGTEVVGFEDEAFTSMIIYGSDRVSYLTGTSATDFEILPIIDDVSPRKFSMKSAGGPVFMDKTGVRRLSTVQEFGNWRVGTLTAQYESFFKAVFEAGTLPTASMRLSERDIYRLFFDDGVAISIYFGRGGVEIGRLNLPITVSCASSSSNTASDGLRYVGATDGYVYQMDVGNSMDGAAISAFVVLGPHFAGAPQTNKRFHTAALEVTGASINEIGYTADFDYVEANTLPSTVANDALVTDGTTWTEFALSTPLAGIGVARLDGKGRNVVFAVRSESDFEDTHTLTAITFNCTYRGTVRP